MQPTIMFSRAAALSADTLMVAAVLDEDNDEAIYQPSTRMFQYEHRGAPGQQWFFDDYRISVQEIAVIEDVTISPARPRFFALLGAEGDIEYLSRPDRHREVIEGAGTSNPGSKYYGKMLTLRQIGEGLYAIGTGGQIYVRKARDQWRLLTDAVLYDPDVVLARSKDAPDIFDPRFDEWLTQQLDSPASPNIILFDIAGLSEDAIYLCGEVGPGTKPVLYFWDGAALNEIKVPLAEAALTGIYIESPDSVWICGREGVLLHGSYARGFAPVNARTRLNLFHGFTPWHDKLLMSSTVRPGGLWQLDPRSRNFSRFEPRLPALKRLDSNPEFVFGGPFFVQAFGEVIWAVASKDIYRFDGTQWERIKHPDLP